jgi:hypothetical protein
MPMIVSIPIFSYHIIHRNYNVINTHIFYFNVFLIIEMLFFNILIIKGLSEAVYYEKACNNNRFVTQY